MKPNSLYFRNYNYNINLFNDKFVTFSEKYMLANENMDNLNNDGKL